jgi:hypothetical protein
MCGAERPVAPLFLSCLVFPFPPRLRLLTKRTQNKSAGFLPSWNQVLLLFQNEKPDP